MAELSGMLPECCNFEKLEVIALVGIDLARPAAEKLPAILRRAFKIEIGALKTIYLGHQFRLT